MGSTSEILHHPRTASGDAVRSKDWDAGRLAAVERYAIHGDWKIQRSNGNVPRTKSHIAVAGDKATGEENRAEETEMRNWQKLFNLWKDCTFSLWLQTEPKKQRKGGDWWCAGSGKGRGPEKQRNKPTYGMYSHIANKAMPTLALRPKGRHGGNRVGNKEIWFITPAPKMSARTMSIIGAQVIKEKYTASLSVVDDDGKRFKHSTCVVQ